MFCREAHAGTFKEEDQVRDAVAWTGEAEAYLSKFDFFKKNAGDDTIHTDARNEKLYDDAGSHPFLAVREMTSFFSAARATESLDGRPRVDLLGTADERDLLASIP